MSDQLFIVLRVCLLALVYLVFLRVLRAVWVELRAEAAVPVGASTGSAPDGRAPSARRPPAPAPSQPAAATTIPGGAARLVILAPAALAARIDADRGQRQPVFDDPAARADDRSRRQHDMPGQTIARYLRHQRDGVIAMLFAQEVHQPRLVIALEGGMGQGVHRGMVVLGFRSDQHRPYSAAASAASRA